MSGDRWRWVGVGGGEGGWVHCLIMPEIYLFHNLTKMVL